MPNVEITNMVMVQNPITGEVIVQNRVKNWCGITFPGGHAENGETIYDSAVREIKEETGLTICNLTSCGFMYWFNKDTEDKYFTYFYKTTDYQGELIDETEEGKVFWVSLEQLEELPLSPHFKEYLPMLLEQKYSEAYCVWSDEDDPDADTCEIIYR